MNCVNMLNTTRLISTRNKNVVSVGVMCNLVQRTVVSTNSKNTNSKVSNLKKYWFVRFVDYVKNYENVLERNFPRTMHVYRIFSDGTKAFYLDLKKYVSVIKKRTTKGMNNLTSDELKLNFTIRRDIIKISPVLLISAVPFTNYVVFPLAYYFPRYLLTNHYWTPKQRIEFMIFEHKKRLKHNATLLKCIQAETAKIKDPTLAKKWNDVIACLGSGSHPSPDDIIYCLELFREKPYGLKNLKRKHVKALLGIHGMSVWRPFRRDRLMERAALIKRMDLAIQREGGVTRLTDDAIQWALSFRGLSPANMPVESMRTWLKDWLAVSETVNENSLSLLLHCPILLAYNHANNWAIVYK